jgi:hypothetical protein
MAQTKSMRDLVGEMIALRRINDSGSNSRINSLIRRYVGDIKNDPDGIVMTRSNEYINEIYNRLGYENPNVIRDDLIRRIKNAGTVYGGKKSKRKRRKNTTNRKK